MQAANSTTQIISRLVALVVLWGFAVVAHAQPTFTDSYPDSLNKKRLWKVVGSETGTYVAGLAFLSQIWYKDHERVPFHYYDDAKGYLQMDKAGHAFGAYRESYAAYYALRWAGLDKKRALIYGGPIGLVFQTPIEVCDGLYEGWGFSWPDMIANTAGAAMFTAQEALWDEQVVLMKFSYSPSPYADMHIALGSTELERFFLDYNAHTYWLSASLKRSTGMNRLPDWLNVAVGYSANGMIHEFSNPEWYRGMRFPHLERHRQWIVSLDVNFSKVPTRKKWVKKVLRAVNLIKVPFPGIEFNRVDGVRFRALYF